MNKESCFSLIILKPDILSDREIQEELREAIRENGLEIVRYDTITMDLEFLRKFYGWKTILHPVQLENYLCKQPLPVWLLRGDDAIAKVLAIKKSIRRHSKDQLHTLIHSPDMLGDFEREYKLLMNKAGLDIMKTNNQIEVIVFRKNPDGSICFLMLKRNPEKGGFWQPITGNVEENETFKDAASRELWEETGVEKTIRIFDTEYSFNFFDDNREQFEKVYAAEIDLSTEIVLSREHTEFIWADETDSLNRYLKYDGNKNGLIKLAEFLRRERC